MSFGHVRNVRIKPPFAGNSITDMARRRAKRTPRVPGSKAEPNAMSKIVYMKAAIGLPLGNFTYQYFADANWFAAAERSWFQASAVFMVWAVTKLTPAHGRSK